MRIHVLQHVEFENPGYILEWGKKHSCSFSYSLLYENEQYPKMSEFDFLLIMGGPMNIYQYEEYPWLQSEKKFILGAIRSGKKVLGICLGAQLIADVLGGKVIRGEHREIGWFDVKLTKEAGSSEPFIGIPEEFTAFHWHGDTFELPEGAKLIASSVACINQAFEYQGRVVGLQFHLESTKESIENLLVNCADEMTDGPYIQSSKGIRNTQLTISPANRIMERLMGNMMGYENI